MDEREEEELEEEREVEEPVEAFESSELARRRRAQSDLIPPGQDSERESLENRSKIKESKVASRW